MRLLTELDLFHTQNVGVFSVNRIVHGRKIFEGGSLSDSSQLVVDRSVANADVSIVGTEVGDGDATQVSAHSRVHCDGVTSDFAEISTGSGVKEGALWEFLLVLDLLGSQSSDESGDSVPGDLDNLS